MVSAIGVLAAIGEVFGGKKGKPSNAIEKFRNLLLGKGKAAQGDGSNMAKLRSRIGSIANLRGPRK